MTLKDLLELSFLLALCALVAAIGEPRPVGLAVGGLCALTVVYATARKLDR